MAVTVHTQRELIKALGGPSALARQLRLGNPANTTTHWTSRGIPSRHWPAVAEMAACGEIEFGAPHIGQLPIDVARASA